MIIYRGFPFFLPHENPWPKSAAQSGTLDRNEMQLHASGQELAGPGDPSGTYGADCGSTHGAG